ncbi:MAG: ABC transporter substrate-binding protein [Gammaproteobacteria bacterium]|nr:ABC transporter substrate-binding protein [Gammaproteobacteria bacterium]
MRFLKLLMWWLTLAYAAVGTTTHATTKMTNVTVQLKWYHQFQFAGFYAAKELGYYRDLGLNVTIAPRDFKLSVLDSVLSGQAQFGVSDGTLIMHRLKGLPVVALLSNFDQSPMVLITRQEDRIINVLQLKNKRIMLLKNQDDSSIKALFKQFDITDTDYQHVELNEPMDALTNKEIDAYTGYITNEPFLHQVNGLAINVINPANYGISSLGNLTFTTESYLASNFDQVNNFRMATIKGWNYALANPDQVIKWLINIYQSPKSKRALEYEANMVLNLFDDMDNIGVISTQKIRDVEMFYKATSNVAQHSDISGFLWSDYDSEVQRYWQWLFIFMVSVPLFFIMLFKNRRVLITFSRFVNSIFSKTALLETQHQQLIEQNILSFRTDEQDNLIFVSPALCSKLGFESIELIGKPRMMIYHPQFDGIVLDRINNKILSYAPWQGEIKYQGKHGESFWHRSQLDPIVKNGRLLGYTALEYDISDQKCIEQSASVEPLSGLLTRFRVEQLIQYERNRSLRTNLPLSVLILNFDGLELIKNKQGSHGIKKMWAMIINIINAEVRISDTLGIWQSQQLLILSPETNAEGVRVLNNKIINAIDNYDFNSPFLPKMVSQVGTLKKEDIDYFIHKIENNLKEKLLH